MSLVICLSVAKLGGSLEPRLPHRFDTKTKKRKRDMNIFVSKLMIYYVVIHVVNHIRLSPHMPNAS